ncbi:uncharacterized protein LOC135937363 [Cloeon dipterum]|uniref:uncharacterized protein LOC135937363 n=1 Tax=Cloeon dipterum TaxID=197152 RepID=UPI00321F9B03
MSFVKQLCVWCERPTVDGAVQAFQLDNEKLQTWFLNVCGFEFAKEIEDEDLICNFCIWHAEFLAKYDSELEALAWWSQDLTCLDEEAKELRKKYLEGKAEQCWVQLEKIELPKSETEENAEHVEVSDGRKSGKKCFYCGQIVANISSHVRKKHENAIRCDFRKCVTYFHTVEEKDKHTKEVHQKSQTKKLIKCNFCEKQFRSFTDFANLKNHLAMKHNLIERKFECGECQRK